MIRDFQLLTSQRNLLTPNITPKKGESLFENVSDLLYKEYFNNKGQGLNWKYQNFEVSLFENEIPIFGLPSPNMNWVVAIYPAMHHKFSSPSNAIIYNADGSIHQQLTAPPTTASL